MLRGWSAGIHRRLPAKVKFIEIVHGDPEVRKDVLHWNAAVLVGGIEAGLYGGPVLRGRLLFFATGPRAALSDEGKVRGHGPLVLQELFAEPGSQQSILDPHSNLGAGQENRHCDRQHPKRR